MRIHIIGGSGSGKTFISKKIGELYKLQVIDLDKIEWVNINGISKKRNIKEKKQLLKEELKNNNIILEGVYFDWCEQSFEESDYIFFINTPLFIQQFRIIRRSIRRKLGIEQGHFKETLKSVIDLLKWNIKYNVKLKKDLFNILAKYDSKVYNVNGYKKIIRILGGIMKDLSIMIDNVKFNYRAGLLIEKNGKVLVECNPEIDFVTLPGGRVKTLESSFEALKREIYEEMQIKIKKEEVNMKAVIENFFEMDNKKYHELYFLYKIKVESGDTRFKEEMKNVDSKASYYKWVKKDKLAEVNLLPVVLREIVKKNKFESVVINDLK